MRYLISSFLILFVFGCHQKHGTVMNYEGSAQGTSFQVKIFYPEGFSGKQIDENIIQGWLSHYNKIASPWDPDSEISKLNSGDTVALSKEMFQLCQLAFSAKVSTNGVVDPTLQPLIEAWGFGVSKGYLHFGDTTKVKALMKFVGDDKWLPKKIDFWAWPKNVQLNFMSLAQGHSVDIIIDSLKSRGADAAFVEVGGEIKTFGTKPSGDSFLIGIEQPILEKRDEFQVLVPLQNRALATSGNYRNFRIDSLNGIKYSHTLNAFSGWPIETEIKSSTVIGASCALADALATAFLAMPLNQVQSWLDNNQEWDAYLIYQNKKGELEVWSSLEDIYN